jgi:hypothetical protein
MRSSVCLGFLVGLLLLCLAGIVEGGDSKELMLVLTTDTNAELNPCG